MRIVHIEDFFHPDAGYQLNLLSKLQAQQGHETIIVTSELKKIPGNLVEFFKSEDLEKKDKRFAESSGVKIIRVPVSAYYSGRAIHKKIYKIVDSLNPDVAFVHGSDTFAGMQFVIRSRRLDYPIVLDNHMLEIASKNRFKKFFRAAYKTFIAPRILKNNIPLIRVVDSDYVEKHLGIPLNRTILLSFGTDTHHFTPNDKARDLFRKKYGIGKDAFVVIYAGKLDIEKGGRFLAESIRDGFRTARGIEFLIVGNAIGTYGHCLEQIFSESSNKILRFPTQPYFDLASFYQAADLAVFPRQCSLSFFDAQSTGLPVLLEHNEINKNRVLSGNGYIFNPGNAGDFRSKISECANMSADAYKKMRENARKYVVDNYDFEPIAQKYTSILEAEVKKFKTRGLTGRAASV